VREKHVVPLPREEALVELREVLIVLDCEDPQVTAHDVT
jgi:hypothetical protein